MTGKRKRHNRQRNRGKVAQNNHTTDRSKLSKATFGLVSVSAFVGLGISLYLVISHYSRLLDSQSASVCNFGGWLDCDAVNASVHSEIFGVPVSLLAAMFYAIVLSIIFWQKRYASEHSRGLMYIRILSVFALLESGYLFLVSLLSIRSFCLFCIGLFAVNIVLFLVTRKKKKQYGPMLHTLKKGIKNELRYWIPAVGVPVAVVTLIAAHQGERLKRASFERSVTQVPHGATFVRAIPGQSFGKTDASVKVLLFSDFECGHCRKAAPVFERLIQKYGDRVNFVYKHFPLDARCNSAIPKGTHGNSCDAALASICAAGEGRFTDFHHQLFVHGADWPRIRDAATSVELQADDIQRCTESITARSLLDSDVEDGKRIGVRSTPTFVIDQNVIPGARDEATLSKYIEDALAQRIQARESIVASNQQRR